MSGTHAFDAQVRVLECRNCGGPATMQLTQGQFECGYCGSINLYSLTAARRPPTEQPPVSFDPRAIAAIEATLADPEHVGWVRDEVSRATGPAALDVTANAPADLRGFTAPASWSTWKSQRIPALRRSWQEAVPRADQGSLDAGSQHRVYWLALRLNTSSRRVLREGCARLQTAVIRGQLSLEQVAPKARARLFRSFLVKVLVVVALIITAVVLLLR